MDLANKAIVEVSPGDRTMVIGPDKVKLVGADGSSPSVKPGGGGGYDRTGANTNRLTGEWQWLPKHARPDWLAVSH